MGDAAEHLTDQGLDQLAAHQRGECEVGCHYCESDPFAERACRICGCTDGDCTQCVERTGVPCHWVEADLCSACAGRVAVTRGRPRRPKP